MRVLVATAIVAAVSFALPACGSDVGGAPPNLGPNGLRGKTVDLNDAIEFDAWSTAWVTKCGSKKDDAAICFQEAVGGDTLTMSGPVERTSDALGYVNNIAIRSDNEQQRVISLDGTSAAIYGWEFACPYDVAGCRELETGEEVSVVATYEYYRYPEMAGEMGLVVKSIDRR